MDITNQILITSTNQSVDFIEINITKSNPSDSWSCTCKIGALSDYQKFSYLEPFTVSLFGEVYAFVCTTLTASRSEIAAIDLVIEGKSPIVMYTEQHSNLITMEEPQAKLASQLVEEILGTSVQWNTYDWVIPGNTLNVEKAPKLSTAQNIVSPIKAILTSDKLGSIIAVQQFPINYSDHKLQIVTNNLFFSDLDDIVQDTESYNETNWYTRFQVCQEEPGSSDRIEWITNDPDKAGSFLRVYPSPWRDGLELLCTAPIPINVKFQYLGVFAKQQAQTVEFIKGKTSVTYPIISISGWNWYSSIPDDVTFTLYKNELKCDLCVNEGYAHGRVCYTTKYYEYLLEGIAPNSLEFILFDTLRY